MTIDIFHETWNSTLKLMLKFSITLTIAVIAGLILYVVFYMPIILDALRW